MNLIDDLDNDTYKSDDAAEIEKSAERLYGLIHQRYIQTRAGIIHMVISYNLIIIIERQI